MSEGQSSPSSGSAWDSLPWSKQVEVLYRRHAPAVYRFALRGLEGNIEQAKDVVQQVFLAVCRQYESDFRSESENRQAALIMTIARLKLDNRAEATAATEFVGEDRSWVLPPSTEHVEKLFSYSANDAPSSQPLGERTDAYIYEVVIDPAIVQTLSPTAFIMVETGSAGRRTVAADCNPGIALLDRDPLRGIRAGLSAQISIS